MSTHRPSERSASSTARAGRDPAWPQRIGSAHEPGEALPPGTERYLTPAARQQLTASDGGSRQPGSGDAGVPQYGQHGSASGQPSQFGSPGGQQTAGHAPDRPATRGAEGEGRTRSGGAQDPRHADHEEAYAAPWGLYGGEYGQFDRSPGQQRALQQDLGFGGEAPPRGRAGAPGDDPGWGPEPRGGRPGWGPGSSQPWGEPARYATDDGPYGGRSGGRSGERSGGQFGGPSGGRYGGRDGADPGADPGRSGGWSPRGQASSHERRERGHPYAAGRYGSSPAGGPGGGEGSWADHDTQGSQDWQGYSGGSGWQPGGPARGYASERPGRPGPSVWDDPDGPPVRDPSHDWGHSDADPWGQTHGGAEGGRAAEPPRLARGRSYEGRSFDNPYGRFDASGPAPLGEHQGPPYAGGRRGSIGSRAGAPGGGWNPREQHGGRYGAQGFVGSGHGGAGWSTPPGAGPQEQRPWDEHRGQQADYGPPSWQGRPGSPGWQDEPGSGPQAGWGGGFDERPRGQSRFQARGGDHHERHAGHHGGPAGGYGDTGRPGAHFGSEHGAHDHSGHHDADHHAHHDPDYHQWRAEQLKNFDDDYREWRRERYRKFSDEFNSWRQGQARSRSGPAGAGGADAGPGSTSAASTGPSPSSEPRPGFAPGSAGDGDDSGFRPASAASDPGRGEPGAAHDIGVGGSTQGQPDHQGAAQGATLPSAGGESRSLVGTSGGPGQPATTVRDTGKAKGKGNNEASRDEGR